MERIRVELLRNPERVDREAGGPDGGGACAQQVDLRANGPNYVPKDQESQASIAYRNMVNSKGSPSEIVAAGYHWMPGTELMARARALRAQEARVH